MSGATDFQGPVKPYSTPRSKATKHTAARIHVPDRSSRSATATTIRLVPLLTDQILFFMRSLIAVIAVPASAVAALDIRGQLIIVLLC